MAPADPGVAIPRLAAPPQALQAVLLEGREKRPGQVDRPGVGVTGEMASGPRRERTMRGPSSLPVGRAEKPR
jgi:hypothetical protein